MLPSGNRRSTVREARQKGIGLAAPADAIMLRGSRREARRIDPGVTRPAAGRMMDWWDATWPAHTTTRAVVTARCW
jgi:hypothetical protein